MVMERRLIGGEVGGVDWFDSCWRDTETILLFLLSMSGNKNEREQQMIETMKRNRIHKL